MAKRIAQLKKNAFSLVEVLLALSLLSILMFSVVAFLSYSQESSYAAGNTARATYLADEGLEASRNIAEEDFALLATGTHGLGISGGVWVLTGSSDTNGEYTRVVTVSTINAYQKQVTATVSWNQEPTGSLRTVSLTTEISDWGRLATPTPTPTFTPTPTVTNTPTPTFTNTPTITPSGSPSPTITPTFTNTPTPTPSPTPMPGWNNPGVQSSIDLGGNNDGVDIEYQGNYAYVIQSNGDFRVIDITNPASPTQVGTLSLGQTSYMVAVTTNFAYVATASNTAEVMIVNISVPAAPALSGSINLGSNNNGRAVRVIGTRLYVGQESGPNDEFYVYNITVPATPVLFDSLSVASDVLDIGVNGNYAYLAATGDEIEIVNMTTVTALADAGSVNLTGGSDGTVILMSGSQMFLGRADGSVVALSASTPTAPVTQSTYSSGGLVNDLSYHALYSRLFVANDSAGSEFTVLDYTTPSSPSLYGSENLGGGATGITYNSGADKIYLTSRDNAAEFQILQPT